MSQSVIFCVYLILSIYTIHVAAQMVEDTSCGTATLRGPLREDGLVEPLLRVEADLYSEDPIVIRCQLNRTADPSIHYHLKLKINFTNLDEEDRHTILKEFEPFPIFESEFHPYPKPLGDIIYYNVSINASARLERSIIACGAEYGPIGMPPRLRMCYTTSYAVIIFQDYDPCNLPTASPEITPTTPPTNFPTSTTKLATASPVTTPTTPPTNSSTSESPTTKWDPTSMPTPIKTPTGADVSDTQSITMNKTEFFPAVGIAILVGILLLVANVIQLWVIIIMRKRRAAAKTQLSARNDVALEQQDIELDHGLESAEDTTIQNNNIHE